MASSSESFDPLDPRESCLFSALKSTLPFTVLVYVFLSVVSFLSFLLNPPLTEVRAGHRLIVKESGEKGDRYLRFENS